MMGADEPAMAQEQIRAASECDLTLDLPLTIRRRGVETKLVIADARDPSPLPDPGLIKSVAQARAWFAEMRKGKACSVRELARRYNTDPGNVSQTLPLVFLAPDIVEAIVDGRQPLDLTATRLKHMPSLPDSWVEQRLRLGLEG
jgi:site-specific DNA recombinase